MTDRPRYAFLDLDGTLVSANLAHVAAHHQARRQSLSGRVAALATLAAASPAMLALDQVSRSAFQEVLYATFRGISADRLRWLGEDAAEKVYVKNLRPGTRHLIDRLRSSGFEPVVVSGSLEHVVGPFCKHLGIDRHVSNRLDIRDGAATGRLVPPIMSGARKAAWIRELCSTTGADPRECHAYSDSAADLPMLAIVGHPCVVHPDRALMLEARAMSWPTIDLDDGAPGALSEPLFHTAD